MDSINEQATEIKKYIESQEKDIYTELLSDPYSVDYISSDTVDNPPLSDMANFSPICQIPKIVTIHYSAATVKASFGCFSEIGKFYSILDNKLFVWSYDTSEPEQIMEDTSIITCVALCGVSPEHKIQRKFTYPNLKYVLIVCTPKYIKIYYVNDKQIKFNEQPDIVSINFSPFCIANGPDGQILLGSSNGGVYLLEFYIDTFRIRSLSRNYQNLFFGLFTRLMNTFVNYQTSAIVELCFDISKTHIAAIDEDGHLHIYKYNMGSCSIMDLDSELDQYEFRSVCATPTRDDSNPHFTAFCKDGTRILLGNGKGFSKIDPPEEFSDDEVVSGRTFMGYTVILGQKTIIMMRGQMYKDNQMYELVHKFDLKGTGVALDISKFDPYASNPLNWQHNHQSPVLYLFTTSGGYHIAFSPPSETLFRLIITNQGKIADGLQVYTTHSNRTEVISNALLACFNHPQSADLLLFFASQFSTQEIRVKHSAFLRLARILEPIWFLPFFEAYESKIGQTKYRLQRLFIEPLQYINVQLTDLKTLLIRYIENHMASEKEVLESSEYDKDKKTMEAYITFIDQIIEILAFFGLLNHQKKKYLTALLNRFENYHKEEKDQFKAQSLRIFSKMVMGETLGTALLYPREVRMEIFTDESDLQYIFSQKITFLQALQEFVHLIIIGTKGSNELNVFAQQLYESCPSLAKALNQSFQFTNAQNELEVACSQGDPTTQRTHLRNVSKVLIKYISECNSKALEIIVSKILKCKEPHIALQVIEAKIKDLDPTNIAIRYFKNGMNENDKKGEELFKTIFDYLNPTIKLIMNDRNGIDVLMSSRLEIIHYHIFNELNASQEKVLIHLNSPYLKAYITDFKPEILWKYYLIHGELTQCYKELVSNAKEIGKTGDVRQIEEVRKLLQLAKTYAQQANASCQEIKEIVILELLLSKPHIEDNYVEI